MMLTGHLDDPLEDALLARAGWARDAEVEAHLGACSDCARRLADAEAAVATVALALPPVPPEGRLRARLFASVDRLERFTPMAPRLAALIDVAPDDARRALHALSEPEAMNALLPGMRVLPLATGPRRATTSAILVCLEPGGGIPRHRHLGDERILVFEGAFAVDDGRVVRAGEELHSPAGSIHAIPTVVGDAPCLCAIVGEGGIEVAL
ncbi:cupin domain-containing protein [Sorangium sp. So ce726]|uniref:cupin domain-containing protein n=1 Tax=Sorangium sp. So ce726 TaxID=3133319 RepID=UPI003F5F1022